MNLLLSVVSIVELVPTLIRVVVLWALVAAVFHQLKGNKSRTLSLCALLVLFASQFSSGSELLPSLVAYSVMGIGGAVTEGLYIRYFADTWDYRAPKVFNLPLWLFPMWAIAAMIVVNLYPVLVKMIDQGQHMLKVAADERAKHQKKINKN
tara:strand:- start:1543 stop:1995 length:453 start_codon:yes stop_codon:yes gene_type:complete